MKALLELIPDQDILFANEDKCAPLVELPSTGRRLWCVHNPQAGADASGAVFIDIELPTTDYTIYLVNARVFSQVGDVIVIGLAAIVLVLMLFTSPRSGSS